MKKSNRELIQQWSIHAKCNEKMHYKTDDPEKWILNHLKEEEEEEEIDCTKKKKIGKMSKIMNFKNK